MRRPTSLIRGAAAACTIGVLIGCGSDSTTGPKKDTLSQTEVQQVAANIFAEVSKALSTLGALAPSGAARSVAAAAPTQSFSSPCTNGGTIAGNFTYTDNTNAQGTGSLNGNITVAPQACKVSTGTRLIDVGGSITFSFTMNFVQFAQSGNFTFHGGGAFTWSGGSCPMDYNVTITPQGKESISGTICGQTVSSNL
jgi:hypothetical protein